MSPFWERCQPIGSASSLSHANDCGARVELLISHRLIQAMGMSDFVNFNKRSVTLPSGCKDLIDLLKGPAATTAGFNSKHAGDSALAGMLTITLGKSFQGGVADIGKHLGAVFASAQLCSTLIVAPPNAEFSFQVLRMRDQFTRAEFIVTESEQEQNLRDVFIGRGLDVPEACGTPMGFDPDLPIQTCFQISPRPAEPELLSKLVMDLFTDLLGSPNTIILDFRFYEFGTASEK